MPVFGIVLAFLVRLATPEDALPRVETPARDEPWTRPGALEAPSTQ
jgi:hypothetical protein